MANDPQPQKFQLSPEKIPLPRFRTDLEIYKGPDSSDGSPTYNVYDPIAAKYFKISWGEMLIIICSEPGISLKDLRGKIANVSPLQLTDKEILAFFDLAKKFNLLEERKSVDTLLEEKEKKRIRPFKWFMGHYLFFRIPLVNPDSFLERTLNYVRPFVSKTAFAIYFVLAFLGFFALVQRFDEYIATFPYFFNITGILAYVIVIFCVKCIHELSHAYTAKYYGIQVPSMGIALLVFWPVFFTDVTHGWRLEKRSHRLAISIAGVIAEMIVAGIALLGWSLVQPGIPKSLFFVLSSSSLISSLFININPALRFDGYYALSDWWGIDNLQIRAFNVLKWKLRRLFFGLEIPCPEPDASSGRIFGMVFYAAYTWVYRFFLMFLISLFIYYTFTKTLGVFLVVMTFYLIWIYPLINEMKIMRKVRDRFQFGWKQIVLYSFLVLFVLWVVLPLPHLRSYPGITVPEDEQVVYTPYAGVVEEVFVQRNQPVQKGDPLLHLSSVPLKTQLALAEKEKEIIDQEISVLSFEGDPLSLSYLAPRVSNLARVEEELKAYQAVEQQLFIRATKEGKVIEWDNDLWVGQTLGENVVVGKIADLQTMQVHGYIPGKDAADLEVGQAVRFYLPSTMERVPGKIVTLVPVASEELKDVQLSSVVGGPIPVKIEEGERLLITESYYLAEIALDRPPEPARLGEIGWVEVRGPWRSYLVEMIEWVLALFWQQSSF